MFSLVFCCQTDGQDVRLRDVTASSGIDFQHFDGANGNQYLVELMCGGVASFDYDCDGLVDIYFTNGHTLPEALPSEASDALFRNLGSMSFERTSVDARISDVAFGLGATVGDYDNDGFPDLFVSNFGRNTLFSNNGDGTFTELGQQAGLATDALFSAGVCFLDFDGDRDLDLFVGNYVNFDFEIHEAKAGSSFPFPPGPRDYAWLPDQLFENLGNGTFKRAQERGFSATAGPTMGTIACDLDADGDQDLLAVSDGAANRMYRNDRGQFVEAALEHGVAFDLKGTANGSMGVDAADITGDGLSEILITTYTQQLPTLFENSPGAFFSDTTRIRAVGISLRPHVNWAVGLMDFDNDSDTDIFVCNGHFLRNADVLPEVTRFAVPNALLLNSDGRFAPNSDQQIETDQPDASSRGAAFEDFDNDGDIDCIILNCGSAAQVLENTTVSSGNWLEVELSGTTSPRMPVGAKVSLIAGDRTQSRELSSGRGYQSHCGTRLHFGLGEYDEARIKVSWPSGIESDVAEVDCNTLIRLVEP